MLEGMAFLVGGVLAGIITKLPATFMHMMSVTILLSRVLYVLSYVYVSSSRWYLRTVWYEVCVLAILAMYWRAGVVLVKNGQLP